MPEALHNYFLNKLNKRTGQGTEQEQTLHAKESKELSKSMDKIKFWELVFHQYSLGVLSYLFDFFSLYTLHLPAKIWTPKYLNQMQLVTKVAKNTFISFSFSTVSSSDCDSHGTKYLKIMAIFSNSSCSFNRIFSQEEEDKAIKKEVGTILPLLSKLRLLGSVTLSMNCYLYFSISSFYIPRPLYFRWLIEMRQEEK